MKDKKNQNKIDKKSLITAFISIFLVTLLIAIWQIISPFQIDNDNIYLKTIASGEMTGSPCAHLLHMGALSGIIISTFYKITGNQIPWFGLFLCLAMAIPMILFLFKSLKACKKAWQYPLVIIPFILFYLSVFYRYFAFTQYTICTGILGVGALFVLYDLSFKDEIIQNNKTSIILLLVLSALSVGMRDKAFFMLIPFIGVAFILHFINSSKKKLLKDKFILLGSFILVVSLVFFGNLAFYSNGEWKDFKKYNSIRESIVDYSGYPPYNLNQATYDELGIKESSYIALTKHYSIIFDTNINLHSMEVLSEKVNENKQSPSFFDKFIEVTRLIIRRNLFEYEDRPLNIFVFVGYLFIFILILIQKKIRALLDLSFIMIARTFDWYYLVWNGRFPFRVTQIVFLAELAMLLILLINYELWDFKTKKDVAPKKYPHPVFILLIVAIIASAIRFGLPVAKQYYGLAYGFDKMSICFEELEDYLESHNENFYFLDMSHLYYMEDTLSFKKRPYENYVYTGSWMANSPWYNEKLAKHCITDPAKDLIEKDNVYFIYQHVENDSMEFMEDFYEEHYPGVEFVSVDKVITSNNFYYEILKPVYVNNDNQ